MRRVVVVLAVVCAAVVVPASASAHARLLSSSPSDGQILDAAPKALVLHFDDAVAVGPGIAAIDGAGQSLLGGTAHATGRALTIPLRPSRDRTYDVRWGVVSDDGHMVTGVVAFTLRGASVDRHAQLSAGSNNPATVDVAGRWLLLAGALVGAGGALFLLAVTSTLRVTVLASIGFAASVAGAVVERSRVPGNTRFANAMDVAIGAGTAGLVLGLLALRARGAGRLLIVPAVALLAAPAFGGHALDAGVPRYQGIVDLLHLAGAATWTGGLAALALTLRTRLGGEAARRFSRIALPAVAVIAATGVLRAYGELTSVSQLYSIGYGRAILIKTALFALLIALGYVARSRLLDRPSALRRSATAEIALLAGLVIAVAFLTALPPGRALATARPPARVTASGPAPPPPHGALTLASHLGSRAVAIAVQQAGDTFTVTATVLSDQATGADGLRVTIDDHAAARCGFGCYKAAVPRTRTVRLDVDGGLVSFRLPPTPWRDGRDLLKRIGERYLQARSATFHERLSSGPGQVVESDWTIAAPNLLSFRASDGSAGIIIGGRRWDRQGNGPWQPSVQDPRVPQPQLPWAAVVEDVVELPPARIDGKRMVRVSFVDPATPAWFTVAADPRTLQPKRLDMVAPVHFMRDTYRSYNAPAGITPPRRG
jgi:copper transport protein